MSDTLNKQFLVDTHVTSVGLIQEDLTDSPLAKFDEDGKEFRAIIDNVKESLSEPGKAAIGYINGGALDSFFKEIKKDLQQDYQKVVNNSINILVANDPKAAIEETRLLLAHRLKNTKADLAKRFHSEVITGVSFNAEDKTKLSTALDNYINKATEKLPEFLQQKLHSLDNIKLRLAQENKELKFSKGPATLRAQGMKNASSLAELTPPSPQPELGFTVDRNDLEQRLRYAIAGKKPGEKVVIEISRPNRAKIRAQMDEATVPRSQGGGFAGFMALLLLLLVYIATSRLIKSDEQDKQNIMEVIKKLYRTYGLSIDPNDFRLKVSQIDENGKEQLLEKEAPLPAEILAGLDSVKGEVNSLFQRKTPVLSDEGYSSTDEEDDEEKQNRSPSISPSPISGLRM